MPVKVGDDFNSWPEHRLEYIPFILTREQCRRILAYRRNLYPRTVKGKTVNFPVTRNVATGGGK